MSENIRTTTMLACAILALAIAVSTRAAKRSRPVHRAFFWLATDISAWYLVQSIYVLTDAVRGTLWWSILLHLGAGVAVALPYLARRLLDAQVAGDVGRGSRRRESVLLFATFVAFGVAFLGPDHRWVRVLLFTYVLVCLGAVLFSLYPRGAPSPLLVARRGASFPFIIGAFACVMTVIDFGNFVQAPESEAPPFGAMFSVVFLFALREALHSDRLPKLRELLARTSAAVILGGLLAGILFGLSHFVSKRFDTTYLNVVLGITVCLSFDVLRAVVEKRTRQLLLPESDLEPSVDVLRRRLLHILTTEEMSATVMDTLHASDRLTGAALFLRDPDDTGFDRIAALGSALPGRVEVATTRPLLDRLATGPLSLEEIERDVRSRPDDAAPPESRDEAALAAAAVLGGHGNTVIAGVRDEAGDLVGLLVIVDERAGGAFSPDELLAVAKIAGHIGVVIESSRAYSEMKARDRLAVIGQMTAGLAHEIRNPLGSIKGAAQLLVRLGSEPAGAAESSKYLGIIVEEVDRLARVLDKVLDLAPQKATVAPIDANAVVRRTLQVFSAEPGHEDLEVREALDPNLPRVEIDPDQFQQVLLNLLRNSAQATRGARKRWACHRRPRASGATRGEEIRAVHDSLVELKVTDNGPGISQKVMSKLFVPFFTTKKEGTGLGLAVSQKIVQEAKGRIEVRSHEGQGTSVAVLLPAAMDALGTPTPQPVTTST